MFKKRKNQNIFYQPNQNNYFKQRPNQNKIIQETRNILGNEKQQPIKQEFQRPKTQTEWATFHKMNEDGIRQAYQKPEGYHIDRNKLYIAGTRNINDVMDWYKIPMGTFSSSHIYKNIEPIFKNNPNIDYVVGHSAGGSAALELEKTYPSRNITSITYNAPVFERADPNKILNENQRPMRFAISGDPVSAFDMNAQTTFKAPNFEKVDPTLGLHSMTGYSAPSKPMDFIKSGIQAAVVGKSLGII